MEEQEIPGSRTEIRVRYAETDQMGHAHHMNYLAWFELGRTELMRVNGLSYAELERTGVLLPVARAELDYRKGAGYDERVEIRTRVTEVRSRSVTFGYEAIRADDLEATVRSANLCDKGVGAAARLHLGGLQRDRKVARSRHAGHIDAAKIISSRQVDNLPVVDRRTRKPIGILDEKDLLKEGLI